MAQAAKVLNQHLKDYAITSKMQFDRETGLLMNPNRSLASCWISSSLFLAYHQERESVAGYGEPGPTIMANAITIMATISNILENIFKFELINSPKIFGFQFN